MDVFAKIKQHNQPEFSYGAIRYGHGAILREFVKSWPDDLPLPVTIRHSYTKVTRWSVVDVYASPLRYHFVNNIAEKERAIQAGFASDGRIAAIGHPTLYLDVPIRSGSGTLCMPATIMPNRTGNFSELLREMARLPERFQPVTMCLRKEMDWLAPECERYDLRTWVSPGVHRLDFYKEVFDKIMDHEYLACSYMGTPILLGMRLLRRVFMTETRLMTRNGTDIDDCREHYYAFRREALDDTLASLERIEIYRREIGLDHVRSREWLLDFMETAKQDFVYRYMMAFYTLSKRQDRDFWLNVLLLSLEGTPGFRVRARVEDAAQDSGGNSLL